MGDVASLIKFRNQGVFKNGFSVGKRFRSVSEQRTRNERSSQRPREKWREEKSGEGVGKKGKATLTLLDSLKLDTNIHDSTITIMLPPPPRPPPPSGLTLASNYDHLSSTTLY